MGTMGRTRVNIMSTIEVNEPCMNTCYKSTPVSK